MKAKRDKSAMEQWPFVGLKIHPDTKRHHKAQAAREGRTLAQEIRKLLDDAANGNGKKGGKK